MTGGLLAALACATLAGICIAGCTSGRAAPDPPEFRDVPRIDASAPWIPIEAGSADALAGRPPSRELGADLNVSRAAAQTVALFSPLEDARASGEIALHAALYREAAALARREGGDTGAFLLKPARVLHAVKPRDYYLRVLAALADLGAPVAWTDADSPEPASLPGASRFATVLLIRPLAYREESGAWTEFDADVLFRAPGGREIVMHCIAKRNGNDSAWTVEPVAALP